MESTMAVDYGSSPPETVTSRPAAPAFLHFAGPMFQENLPILKLFTSFLTAAERERWEAQVNERRNASRWLEKWPFFIRLLNRLIGSGGAVRFSAHLKEAGERELLRRVVEGSHRSSDCSNYR
jgi:hypothetical protein